MAGDFSAISRHYHYSLNAGKFGTFKSIGGTDYFLRRFITSIVIRPIAATGIITGNEGMAGLVAKRDSDPG